MSDERATSCRVTLLTPAGRGAIAVISLEGEDATRLLRQSFAPARPVSWERVAADRILFGRWTSGEAAGEETVVCRTPGDSWEIHCHGGVAAPEAVLQSLLAAGAKRGDSVAWTRRQSPDAMAASARVALAAARTERAAAVLLDQYRGALRTGLERLVQQIDGDAAAEAEASLRRLDQLSRVGLRLTQPWRVVVAGPVNAGKSSLANALLGYPRAIVFAQPGTTRDVLTAQTALDGWPIELVDTAGLRAAQDPIETEGVARAQAQIAAADLVVLVFDATAGWPDEHRRLAAAWPRALVVGNQCDRLPATQASFHWGLPTSAVTGLGIDSLRREIVRRLVPSPPRAGEAVPFLPQQAEAVRSALNALQRGSRSAAHQELARLLQ